MSRMWLKNGRAVLTDGRVVLCDECPCGCRYTYYVDHSLETSGDGHSLETAFNSINDAFNSSEIYGYRYLGCKIYVKIVGNVDYFITGTYITSHVTGAIVLLPNDSSAVVSASFSGYRLIEQWAYNVIFRKWDIVLNVPESASGYSFSMEGNAEFSDCAFEFNYTLGDSGLNIGGLYTTGGGLYINNCSIFALFHNEGGSSAYRAAHFRVISIGSSAYLTTITNTNIEIDISNPTNRRLEIYGIIVKNNYILENNNVDIVFNRLSSIETYNLLYCYSIEQGSSSIDSCTGSFSLNVSSSTNYLSCRFRILDDTSPTFFNCEQYCHFSGSGYDCNNCPTL